jgi:predicted metal-binding membrane protein
MLLLFVGGVMNLLWIAGLMILVLVEKIAPHARWIVRAAGLIAIAAGLWLLR